MVAAFSFGPLGAMTDLVVAPGLSPQNERGISEFISSGGVRHVQVGRRNPRRWVVSRPWRDPKFWELLSLAGHGMLGATYLYDRTQAMLNMLPADLCKGSGAPVLVRGLPMGAVTTGAVRKVPVIAGRLYTVSAWTSGSNGQVLSWHLGSGPAKQLSSLQGFAEAAFTPTEDSILTVTVNRSDVSGLRVHEGAPDGGFKAGDGTPCRVVVKDPALTYQMVIEESVNADVQVELIEVGLPGEF